jgi:nitrate/TMAO reductase-like tetraheme cytochrome c subunit
MKIYQYKLKIFYATSLLLCCVLYIFTSCGVNKEFQVTANDADKLKNRGYMATTKELEEGYKLYVVKCGNCHNLTAPSKYTTSEWQLTYINKELEKAKVEDSKEKKLISMFIFSKSK